MTPPTIIVVREATVGPELGTSPVSGGANTRSSISSPPAAAAICGKTTAHPWPMSVIAVSTSMRPSSSKRTVTGDCIFRSPWPVKPAPWK